jgi:FkbM family methyltransferase
MFVSKIRALLSNLLHRYFPSIFWKRKLNFFQSNYTEIELHLLPILCDINKTSIDIGGSIGCYTANMVKYSKDVVTFEPIPSNVNFLLELVKFTKIPVEINEIALSDHSGVSQLQMVDVSTGFSTIETQNDLSKHSENVNSIDVKVEKLDSYKIKGIGFIKIDVEGHEYSVLKGSINTISDSLPNILVEIEERHNKGSILKCVNILEKFGYEGFYILDKKIHPVSNFDILKYQNENYIKDFNFNDYNNRSLYINNFLFLPEKNRFEILNELNNTLHLL